MSLVMDPVCGKEVDTDQTEHRTTYENEEYYFCSEECMRIFLDNPAECLWGPPPSSDDRSISSVRSARPSDEETP